MKTKYTVKSPLSHDNITYAIDEPVELDDKTAASLLAEGVVVPAEAPESKSSKKNS